MTSQRSEALTGILDEFGGNQPNTRASAEVLGDVKKGFRDYLERKGIGERESDEIISATRIRIGKVEEITGLGFDDKLLSEVIAMEISRRRYEAQTYDQECLAAVIDAKRRFSKDPMPRIKVEAAPTGNMLVDKVETTQEAQERVAEYQRAREVFHEELKTRTEHQYPIKMVLYRLGKREFYNQNEPALMRFAADHTEVISQVSEAQADDERFYDAIALAAVKSVENRNLEESFEPGAVYSLATGRLHRQVTTLDDERPTGGVSRAAVYHNLCLKMIPDRARAYGRGMKEEGPSADDIERTSGGRVKLAGEQIEVDGKILQNEGGTTVENLYLKQIKVLKVLAGLEVN